MAARRRPGVAVWRHPGVAAPPISPPTARPAAPPRDARGYASLCSPASGRGRTTDPASWGAPSRAISSVEERYVHTVEASGSNPLSPTWGKCAVSGCPASRRTVPVVLGTRRPARAPRQWSASARLTSARGASLPQQTRPAGTGRTSSTGTASPRPSTSRCWRTRGMPAPSAVSHSRVSGSAGTTTTPAAPFRPAATRDHAASAYAGCCASGATPGSGGWRRTAVR